MQKFRRALMVTTVTVAMIATPIGLKVDYASHLALAFDVAKADLPPPPPKPAAKPAGGDSGGKKSHSRKLGKVAARAAECLFGDWIIGVGKPVPLKKMSKRQFRRYRVELAFHNRARGLWRVACPIGGTVAGAGAIAVADFVSRFVTRERPIKRTPRQERQMFWIAGGEPRPDFSKPDPDLYGPR